MALKRSDAFTEEISPYLKSINFTMPGIQEGSVFELIYSIRSPFLYSFPVWFFQNEYPTLFSELHLYIPEYFSYKPLMQGFLTLSDRRNTNHQKTITITWNEEPTFGGAGGTRRSESVTYRENILTYRLENAPAFRNEPYMNAEIVSFQKLNMNLLFSGHLPAGQPISAVPGFS